MPPRTAKPPVRVRIFYGADNRTYWRSYARNGKELDGSTQGYRDRRYCRVRARKYAEGIDPKPRIEDETAGTPVRQVKTRRR